MNNMTLRSLLSFVVKVVQSRPALPHERFNPRNPAVSKDFVTMKNVTIADDSFVSALKRAVTERNTLHDTQTMSGKTSARVLLSAPTVGKSVFPAGASSADKEAICESLRTEHTDPFVRSLWYTVTRDGNGIAVSDTKPEEPKTFDGTSVGS